MPTPTVAHTSDAADDMGTLPWYALILFPRGIVLGPLRLDFGPGHLNLGQGHLDIVPVHLGLAPAPDPQPDLLWEIRRVLGLLGLMGVL